MLFLEYFFIVPGRPALAVAWLTLEVLGVPLHSALGRMVLAVLLLLLHKYRLQAMGRPVDAG